MIEIIDSRKRSNPEDEPKIKLIDTPESQYDSPKPMLDYILIKRNEKSAKLSDGSLIIIPDSVQRAPNIGIVVNVSDFYLVNGNFFPMSDTKDENGKEIPGIVNIGDIVQFGEHTVEEIKVNDEDFVLCHFRNIKLRSKRHIIVSDLDTLVKKMREQQNVSA